MHDRIKELRKNLDLSQKQFGERISLSQTHIASLENGKRSLTERIISDLCRVFGVRREWLLDGSLPMYSDILKDLPVDDDIKQLVGKYIRLNDKDRAIVDSIVDSFFEKIE